VEERPNNTGASKMTISVAPARNEYTGNAGQTIFNFTFKIFSITDLNVYITPTGQEANDSTDITVAYTVLGLNDEDGGTITLNSGVNANDLVTIVSNVPSSRTVDYQNNGDFRPDTVNTDFDTVVSIVKKIEDDTNRSLLLPQSQQGPKPLSLPNPLSQAIMRWKSDLTGLENTFVSELSPGVFPNDAFTLQSTLTAVVADTGVLLGQVYILSDRANGLFDVVLASSVTPNNIDIVICTGVPTLALKLRLTDIMNWAQFGVTYSGADESAIVQRACDVAINLVGKGRNSSIIGLSTQITTTRDVEISKSNFKALSIMEAMFDCPTVISIHDNKFDGDDKAERAIRSRVNCEIYDNTILNIKSSSVNLAAGIFATLTSANKGSINIYNNDIDSVVHTNTGGSIGSDDGSARSIIVKLFVTCTRCAVTISDNICIDTFGREGDAILTSDQNFPGNNIFTVTDNNILGFNRRGVKIQSSNTSVSLNNIEDIADTDVKAIQGKYSIETASSANADIHIFDNTINVLSLSGAVNIFQAVKSSVHDNTITVTRDSSGSLQPVVFQYGENVKCTINDNVAETNHFVIMSDAGTLSSDQGITIRDNEITSTSLTGPVAANATFLNISAASLGGNILFNTVKGDIEDLVVSSSILTNFRVTRNDILATNGKGRVVNAPGITHVNCLALNNTTDGVNQPFPATLTGWKKYGNYHPTHTSNVNDQDLLVERGSAITDSAGGTEIATINAILAELRVKNIIAP